MIGETVAHYEILEKLGEGGMGVVYKALDTRLRRLVALKFLPQDLVASPSRIERFEAEARSISSLNHPHIATIHAMDEAGGRHFLVLEYLAGGTLRKRICFYQDRGELFPLAEAIRTIASVAEGLGHAHRNGIVHRDLKPENIMFTEEGIPRITDFGLARSSRGAEITTEGMTVGTVPYIAPEQAVRGDTSPRADLFALGVVLYEMLAGERPFSGATDFATLQSIVSHDPAPLRAVRPDLPQALEPIVATLLEKEPDRRYQSADAVAADLHSLLGNGYAPLRNRDVNVTRTLTRFTLPLLTPVRARRRRRFAPASVAAVLAMTGGAWYAQRMWRNPQPAVMQVAVLPFTASSGTPDDAAFGGILAETLAGRLASTSPNVHVIPQSDLARNHVLTPSDAYGIFHLKRVLTGEIQRLAGTQTQVRIHLVDARSGRIIRSGTLVSAGPELDQDAFREAKTLLGLSDESPPPRTASDYYERGLRYLERYDKSGHIGYAIAAFMKAKQLDPSYALAYAGLAKAYWRAYVDSRDRQYIDKAREQANEALMRNDKLAMAHVVLGAIAVRVGPIDDGIRELKYAIQLNPVDADAYRELGNAYAVAAKPADAEASYKQAIQTQPDWMSYDDLGIFYNNRADYRKAEDAFRKAAALSNDNNIVYRNLGGVEQALGKWADAEKDILTAIRLRPEGTDYSNLGTLYIYEGRYPEAISMLEKAVAFGGSKRHEIPILCSLGDAYSGNGNRRQALDSWKKAIALAEAELESNPRNAVLESLLAAYEAKTGRLGAAREHIREALANMPGNYDVLFYAAVVAELDHRRRDALAALRSALENGYSLSLVQREPELVSLRNDPAYAAIETHAKERK